MAGIPRPSGSWRPAIRLTGSGLLPILLALAAVSCSAGGNAGNVNGIKAQRHGFSIRLLEGSGTAQPELSISEGEDGRGLELAISTEQAVNLSRLYVEIEYDAASLVPLAASPAECFSQGGQCLQLLATVSPGVLHYGQLLAGKEPAGVNGVSELATISFRRIDGGQMGDSPDPQRSSSRAIPAVDDLSRNARWNIISWSYMNPGDYDQNGVVSISDLTPLGQNFKASGPFSPASALWMVDGDGNGEINLADISVIGQNFGNSVSGYELSADDGVAGIRNVASLEFADAGAAPGERLRYQVTDLAVRYGDRYHVVPLDGGSPSNLSEAWNGSWHAVPVLTELATQPNYAGRCLQLGGTIMLFRQTRSGSAGQVAFSRSLDPLGDDWTEPVIISGSHTYTVSPTPTVHDGLPVYTFGDGDSGRVHLQVAQDPLGESWQDAAELINGGFFPRRLHSSGGRVVGLERDNSVDAWVTDAALGTFGSTLHVTPDVLRFHSIDSPAGFYMIYDDMTGVSWFRSLAVQGDSLVGSSPLLLSGDSELAGMYLLDGPGERLHALLWHGNTADVYVQKAGNPSASTWTIPKVVGNFSLNTFAMTSAYGRIWSISHNGGAWDLRLSQADTTEPWSSMGGLPGPAQPLGNAEMLTVRGHPAAFYRVDTGSGMEVWFAIWY